MASIPSRPSITALNAVRVPPAPPAPSTNAAIKAVQDLRGLSSSEATKSVRSPFRPTSPDVLNVVRVPSLKTGLDRMYLCLVLLAIFVTLNAIMTVFLIVRGGHSDDDSRAIVPNGTTELLIRVGAMEQTINKYKVQLEQERSLVARLQHQSDGMQNRIATLPPPVTIGSPGMSGVPLLEQPRR